MSADIMPCGCEGHADNEELCRYPGLKSTSADQQARIAAALNYAVKYGSIDGAHHKDWVIDQMVRALTGCKEEIGHATDVNGKPYSFRTQGKSHEYLDLVRKACEGEDGPNTYDWDEGIAP